jgi:hypothetical protein
VPGLAKTATAAAFLQVTLTRYGKTETIAGHAFTCLWYPVVGAVPVTVILIRDKQKTGEGAIEGAKAVVRHRASRNRTARVVERTIPFMLACQAPRRLLERHRPPPRRCPGPPPDAPW